MKKKIFSFLIVIFSAILCFGCSKATYTVAYLDDGTIEQSFSVAIDKEVLEQKGYSYSESILKIRTIYNSFWTDKCIFWHNNLNNNANLTNLQKQSYLSSITHEIKETSNSIALVITYLDSTALNYINGESEAEDETNNIEKHLFYSKVTLQNAKNIYFGYKETELYEELMDFYSSEDESFTEDDMEFQQVLCFKQKRIHSNADQIVAMGDEIYHIWNVSTSEPNANIKLYRIYARPTMWYVVALAVVGIFVVVSLIYVKKKKTDGEIKVIPAEIDSETNSSK